MKKFNLNKIKNLFLTLTLLGACFQLTAQVNWTGNVDNDWNTAGNWDAGVPTSTDEVVIDDGVVTLTGASATVLKLNLLGNTALTIDMGTTLTIDGFTGNDDGLEGNSSTTVTNNGTIEILNITGGGGADGLQSRGTFINNGSISIDGAGQHGLYMIGGSFTNGMNGTITVTNFGQAAPGSSVSGDGVYVDDASGTLNTFTNDGTITVTMTSGTNSDDGIYLNDGVTLENNSVINISSTTGGDNGLRVDDGSVFNNNSGATLDIDVTPDDQLFLDNTGSAFNNSGTVNLDDGSDVGLYVTDASTFTNMVNGMVNITNASNFSMQLDANGGSAEIVNNGTITVTGGKDALRIQESGIYTNNASGTLNITSPNEDGINIQSSGGTLNNSGTIDISDAPKEGLDMSAGTFNNNAGGLFKAVDCLEDNIEINGTSAINNDGDIRVSTTMGDASGRDDIEINGTATFNNSTNASATTFAPGNSPGEMEVRGDFDLGSSTTTFEITGTSAASDYDQIENTNGSTLTISSAKAHLDWGSYIPDDDGMGGPCYVIVDEFSTVNGPFSSITSSNSSIIYTVDYSSPGQVIICFDALLLPVELTYFTGEKTDQGSELSWATASEENNAHFEVEHSINGRDFSMLEKVEGNGTSVIAHDYSYVHKNPANGDNYYRLKQVDFNGNFEYSNIVHLRSATSDTPVSIYPNPAQDVITYEGTPATLTIYDIYGRAVLHQTTAEKTTLDISRLEIGVYTIEVLSDTNEKTFQRFVKK